MDGKPVATPGIDSDGDGEYDIYTSRAHHIAVRPVTLRLSGARGVPGIRTGAAGMLELARGSHQTTYMYTSYVSPFTSLTAYVYVTNSDRQIASPRVPAVRLLPLSSS